MVGSKEVLVYGAQMVMNKDGLKSVLMWRLEELIGGK